MLFCYSSWCKRKFANFDCGTPWRLCFVVSSMTLNEPPHHKTNKMACAPSEVLDQPGHPPSLIRVFAFRMKKAWVLSYPLSAQQRLIRLGRCPGWSESSLGAQIISLVLSWGGSNQLCFDTKYQLIWFRSFSYLEVFKAKYIQDSYKPSLVLSRVRTFVDSVD